MDGGVLMERIDPNIAKLTPEDCSLAAICSFKLGWFAVDGEPPLADVGKHLARHGVKAHVKEITADVDVANTILSYAADSSTDVMVMGGYGHSRLREFIFGG